jgi:transcriptional regulator with XRE-family HTH domain
MRGRKITPEQIEQIKAAYAETESLTKAAEAAGVSKSTASQYVSLNDEFEQVRTEKRLDIIEAIAKARIAYAEHLLKPEVVAQADPRDAATVLGILVDKHQLLTGKATERRENVNVNEAREDLRRRLGAMAGRQKAMDHELRVVDGTADGRTG